jgi:hypothetical protein
MQRRENFRQEKTARLKHKAKGHEFEKNKKINDCTNNVARSDPQAIFSSSRIFPRPASRNLAQSWHREQWFAPVKNERAANKLMAASVSIQTSKEPF